MARDDLLRTFITDAIKSARTRLGAPPLLFAVCPEDSVGALDLARLARSPPVRLFIPHPCEAKLCQAARPE